VKLEGETTMIIQPIQELISWERGGGDQVRALVLQSSSIAFTLD
jgi:hypothetical protein